MSLPVGHVLFKYVYSVNKSSKSNPSTELPSVDSVQFMLTFQEIMLVVMRNTTYGYVDTYLYMVRVGCIWTPAFTLNLFASNIRRRIAVSQTVFRPIMRVPPVCDPRITNEPGRYSITRATHRLPKESGSVLSQDAKAMSILTANVIVSELLIAESGERKRERVSPERG